MEPSLLTSLSPKLENLLALLRLQNRPAEAAPVPARLLGVAFNGTKAGTPLPVSLSSPPAHEHPPLLLTKIELTPANPMRVSNELR